jgi:uncharacterized protein YqjF (DUF2071 family)
VPVAIAFDWDHLLFEHYPVDPAVVAPHLPEGLEVDIYDGDAWLSVVPFVNAHVRPAGLPRRLGVELPELNLRTYVTHGDDEGVYFFSLDAQGVLGVAGARIVHHLPYFYARIDLDAVAPAPDAPDDDGDAADVPGDRVRFRSRRRHPGARPAVYEATYEPTGPVEHAEPGSLAAFLTERYRYYAAAPDGLRFAQVQHERWPLQPATATVVENTLFDAAGFDHPGGEPVRQYVHHVEVTATPSLPVE